MKDINYKIIETEEFEDIEIYEGKNKIGIITMNLFLSESFDDVIVENFEIKNTINKKDKESKKNLTLLKNEMLNVKEIIYIEEIKIKKAYQNQGYGTKLLNFTLERLKSKKEFKKIPLVYIVRAKIENVEFETLEKIYKKFGFSNSIVEKDSIRLFNKLENLTIYEKYSNLKKDKRLEMMC